MTELRARPQAETGSQATKAHPDWRYVEGHPSYLVGRCGKVFSLKSKDFLKPYLTHGYETISLRDKGTRRLGKVHRLVCAAFNGSPPADSYECAHLDGNKLNNRADNLKWVTHKENEAHKREHGTAQVGEKSAHAKLTNEQALIVRAIRNRPATVREIAVLVGVSEVSIYSVIAGDTYVEA